MWREPEHAPRQDAVSDTLDAPNRWTEQALAHVINRRMQSLTGAALESWIGDIGRHAKQTVGVIHGDAGPLDGFRLALAAWVSGADYVGRLPKASPALVAAFAEDLPPGQTRRGIDFADQKDEVFDRADMLLARPSSLDAAATMREKCNENGIPPEQRLIQPPVFSVGLLDGHETDDERERLAEDMLLLEGTGRRRVALLWAPRDLDPDPYLQSMARFRGVYPVHPDTPGTLQMQQAFLDARDEPHAYAEGLEFLVSRGDPSLQKPGHIRWAEYDDLSEAVVWGEEHSDEMYGFVARASLHDQISSQCSLCTPGGVHVPPMDDWEGEAVAAVLGSSE